MHSALSTSFSSDVTGFFAPGDLITGSLSCDTHDCYCCYCCNGSYRKVLKSLNSNQTTQVATANDDDLLLGLLLPLLLLLLLVPWGAMIAQRLERRTHDLKVVGSNLCRSGGRISFSGINFLY